MKRLLLLPMLLTLLQPVSAQENTPVPRPKLVVGLVVDQMRWDYLYRYYDRYGKDGFRRLLGKGFACQNTLINYLPSYTAPGHAAIYTGSVPAIHGIAGNNWIDNRTGRSWYCTEDTAVAPVGGSKLAGQMSPRNLVASTITDELRLATNFRSRVYGISLKDRGSILPAGHRPSGAYWFDDATGRFITSTYYEDSLPAWVARFNERQVPDSLLRLNWNLLQPAAAYRHSLPDDNPYEGSALAPRTFPKKTEQAVAKTYGAIRFLPAGNTLTLMMADACIRANGLGKGTETDFLCLSLSATDYAGHQYGPNALEMEDMYLRLDRDLAAFLKDLDGQVGAGNYLLFLTADHGAAHNGTWLQEQGLPGGNVLETATARDLKLMTKGKLGLDSGVVFENYQVYVSASLTDKDNRTRIKEAVRQWFLEREEVAFVVELEQPDKTPVPEPIRTMTVNGYYRQRSGVLQVVYKPGWYGGYSVTGTNHGTWNPYDTHIPLLWYGWRIPKGETHREVHITDIAATLAALLHIQMPGGCIGRVIPVVGDR